MGLLLETMYSVVADPSQYNHDLRHLRELRQSLEAAVEDGGGDIVYIQWSVKCSIKFYKCAINPAINPKSVCESHTTPRTRHTGVSSCRVGRCSAMEEERMWPPAGLNESQATKDGNQL
jgi:hypothetical protein